MNAHETATAIIKAIESSDVQSLYGIALELLRTVDKNGDSKSYEQGFREGNENAISYLADLFDGVEETDIWAEYMNEENN